ncbi:AAA domain protein [compost metagenome]
MDSRDDCRITKVLEPVPDDLEAFANELQQRIAQAEPGTRLYYPIDNIRTLLGGMAMSQLHVFQGISGTGKTSLAKAFAKAMGGFCTDIAVQAGWRDSDDLLGHYNAFEKRFYEKDCLQALYQAQTEAWKDRCNIILLDEMNLSRPEQYFAEFLSALEKNNPEERLITLSEKSLEDAPRLLKEQRKILVPKNVWFIGTANHDETTNELADKTYDRAHVMVLPRQEETFDIHPLPAIRYSFSSLQDRFNKAVVVNQDDVQELLEQLKYSDLTSVLAESFDLGWGNRFERQAKRFIPVMIECGASQQDALDHLLSTRVMRSGKVTGRYDISVEQLGRVEDALDQFWKEINGGEAVKSKRLLAEDRRRKERGA